MLVGSVPSCGKREVEVDDEKPEEEQATDERGEQEFRIHYASLIRTLATALGKSQQNFVAN